MRNQALLLFLVTFSSATILTTTTNTNTQQPVVLSGGQQQEATKPVLGSPVSSSTSTTTGGGGGSRCQEITIPMCKSIRYNLTEMPNPFNHETQEEAGLEVHQYWPLVEIKCSDDLKFFICSLYVPICMDDYAGTVPPCRSVCERARAGCEPVMTQYGFFWPERMVCDQFPKFGKHSICMDEKGGEMPSSSSNAKESYPSNNNVLLSGINSHTKIITPPQKPQKCNENTDCSCRYPLVEINPKSYVTRGTSTSSSSSSFFGGNTSSVSWIGGSVIVRTGGVTNCGFPCRGYGYGTQEEIRFANYWLTFWSSVTCGLSTLTILTFLIDSSRFNYPERPIICISFCYVFVSLGYLARMYNGHAETACGGPDSPIVRYPGLLVSPYQTASPVCTLVFLLIYYFTIASSIWYVVLTITWYLASVLKWGTEAISEKSGVFHATVWVSSAIITLAILLTDAIDGDSISGICFVGNQEYWNLMAYVLIPMGGMLCLGTLFLVTGFVALLRIRRVIVSEVRNVHKLEKLMIRIGVFGVLYTLNVVAVLAAYVYEAYVREQWGQAVNCGGGGACSGVSSGSSDVVVVSEERAAAGYGAFKPAYSVLMIKYFMSLAIGLTSSIWVFSSKTLDTWRRFVYSRFLFLCFPSACSSSSSSATSQQTTSILTNNHHHHHHLHMNKQTHV